MASSSRSTKRSKSPEIISMYALSDEDVALQEKHAAESKKIGNGLPRASFYKVLIDSSVNVFEQPFLDEFGATPVTTNKIESVKMAAFMEEWWVEYSREDNLSASEEEFETNLHAFELTLPDSLRAGIDYPVTSTPGTTGIKPLRAFTFYADAPKPTTQPFSDK